jgi:protein gp37
MGVSVEDTATLDRVDDLREVPTAVRFLSCEPLLSSGVKSGEFDLI